MEYKILIKIVDNVLSCASALLLIIFSYYADNFATSMVYNFRIAQATKPSLLNKQQDTKQSTLVTFMFDQYQKRFDDVRQNFFGGLESYMYNHEKFYFRADAAFAHVCETIKHNTLVSELQTDDILLTCGYNFFQHDKTAVSFSGLLGIPTHTISDLSTAAFGFSQYSIGVQLDALYLLNSSSALVGGSRYVYFIPRVLTIDSGQKFNFSFGSLADFLCAYRRRWSSNHGMEIGYTFHAAFSPEFSPNPLPNTLNLTYNGSAFYGVYMYKFFINNTPNRFFCNISYAFQHHPPRFGIKYIITWWLAWSISF